MKKYNKLFVIFIYIFLATIGVTLTCLNTHKTDLAFNGVVDENTFDNNITTTYDGWWELYYNKLVVTDNIDISNTKYDALIKLPNSWYNLKTTNNEILPLNGYATYRLIVNNLHEGDVIKIKKLPTNVCINIFINRKLIGSVGNVTKDLVKSDIFYHNLDEYKVSYNEQIEILIEVGLNNFGGIVNSPSFTTTTFKDSVEEITKYSSLILLFFFLGLFLVELVSYFKIYDSTLYTVNTVLCIFFLFLFSSTINEILSNYNFYILPFLDSTLNFIFYCLFLFTIYQFCLFTYSYKLNKKMIIFYSILIIVTSILYLVLYHFNLQYISFIFITIVFVFLIMKIAYFKKLAKALDFTFYFTMFISFSVIGFEITIITSGVNQIKISPNLASIIYLFFIYLFFLSIYILFIIRTYKEASKSLEYELQNQKFKSLILKEQIKPHFIFNSLNAIKTLYHEDLDKGDYALTLLSKHLRFNVNTIKTNLIGFDKEIDNIYNFIELENLKVDNKFDIIFNIDYHDFLLPILSLQPFVENSIKYSKVNYKEDGYIEISAYKNIDDIIIEINDNGIGFDVNNIKNDSCGIKNTKERFKILLNADINIISQIGVGTNVTILIPNGGKNENNNS